MCELLLYIERTIMRRQFYYPVSDTDAGMSIEQFLKSKGYSHPIIVSLRKDPEGLLVEGKKVYTTHKLQQGEVLFVCINETASSPNIVPSSVPFSIVYEDEDLLVINKPSDTPIHPSQGNYDNTLANGLAYYFSKQNCPFIYRAINRLDRDTTGLLIIAKHALSAAILSRMVTNRTISRHYLAIADGILPEHGIIEAPIARLDGSTIERCVDFSKGEYAKTEFWRLASFHDRTLIKLKLETGRTHQIRVHMKHIQHPLLGDFIYHPDYRYIKRQALHSYSLDFIHPITKEPMHFTAPLPDDMIQALKLPIIP